MANIDKGVLFNYEWIEACKELTADDFKKLFFAIASFQKYGTPFPEFDGTLKIISTLIFPCIKNRVESAILGKQGALTRWGNTPNSPPNSPPINQDKISKDKISKDNYISPYNPPLKKGEGEKNKKGEDLKRLENQFNEFWSIYPKKVSKAYAKKIYIRIAPSPKLHCIMLEAIAKQKQSKQWQNEQFIPNPSTWLSQEKWNDELEANNSKFARLDKDYSKDIDDLKF